MGTWSCPRYRAARRTAASERTVACSRSTRDPGTCPSSHPGSQAPPRSAGVERVDVPVSERDDPPGPLDHGNVEERPVWQDERAAARLTGVVHRLDDPPSVLDLERARREGKDERDRLEALSTPHPRYHQPRVVNAARGVS